MKKLMQNVWFVLSLVAIIGCADQEPRLSEMLGDSVDVNPSDLPSAVQTYIASNYPNTGIYEAELEDECGQRVYEVELTDGVALHFDLQGNFLGTEDDFDCSDEQDGTYDDDDYVDPDSLPSAVQRYIASQYPSLSIYEVERDDECDQEVYEVELSNGLELYFDLQGNFLGTDDTFDCDDDD